MLIILFTLMPFIAGIVLLCLLLPLLPAGVKLMPVLLIWIIGSAAAAGFSMTLLKPGRWLKQGTLAALLIYTEIFIVLVSLLPQLLTCSILIGAAMLILLGALPAAWWGSGLRRALIEQKKSRDT